MLSIFFTLAQQLIIDLQLLPTINGTFVLELLAEFLEIGKTNIPKQGFASMDAGSQNGKIPVIESSFNPLPVYRQIPQEIFEHGFCVYGIAFE